MALKSLSRKYFSKKRSLKKKRNKNHKSRGKKISHSKKVSQTGGTPQPVAQHRRPPVAAPRPAPRGRGRGVPVFVQRIGVDGLRPEAHRPAPAPPSQILKIDYSQIEKSYSDRLNVFQLGGADIVSPESVQGKIMRYLDIYKFLVPDFYSREINSSKLDIVDLQELENRFRQERTKLLNELKTQSDSQLAKSSFITYVKTPGFINGFNLVPHNTMIVF